MAELLKWRRGPVFVALSMSLAGLVTTSAASAQLHWDAAAQVGVQKHVLAGRPSGSPDAGFGPTAQVAGHVALLPLLRIGGYFGHEISPIEGDFAARRITFGGLRAKAMLPWVRGTARAWFFAGFGYAGVYAPSYTTELTIVDGAGSTNRKPGRVQGTGGGYFDVPFGFGASYKLYKPWELFAELGARVGFGHSGSTYEPPGPRVIVPSDATQNASPSGLDRLSLGLTVGILLDL